MTNAELALIFAGLAGSTIRIATPLMFAAVGDCLAQRSGQINLGLEGAIPCAAACAVAVSASGAGALAGVLAALAAGIVLSWMHWACCLLKRVNEIATGVALLIFSLGLARYIGADLAAAAPEPLPAGEILGLPIGLLLTAGLAAAILGWILAHTRWGVQVRAVGLDADLAAHAHARVQLVRFWSSSLSGLGSGAAGASLGLWYPIGWSDNLGAGIGISAIVLTFLAKTGPMRAALAAILFAALAALGPALQIIGSTAGYHLLNAMPYVFVLVLLAAVAGSRKARA